MSIESIESYFLFRLSMFSLKYKHCCNTVTYEIPLYLVASKYTAVSGTK